MQRNAKSYLGGASAAERVEQSSRKQAPTNTATREEDETFQISLHKHNVFSLLLVPFQGISSHDVTV
jgi:hypothetical protein